MADAIVISATTVDKSDHNMLKRACECNIEFNWGKLQLRGKNSEIYLGTIISEEGIKSIQTLTK